ncbi:MAG TPA: trypsin-like serine protease [Geminicoccus sp.]|uniref:trypsin-like serine peptidase n=1 Tax=Geminicoccus sp. TaxID=2024832 RepID=UPI002E345DF7|nr:trypsin-like serine protease [Geminicoccus sp.]HEX2527120.1 trypsin-like serine protease [Geminicoccus sp.]
MSACRLALITALFLSIGGADPLWAEERTAVDGWPTFAVGKVNVRGGGFCTATLVAPDRMLTAAHCLRDASGRWYHPTRLMVELSPHRDGRKGHAPVRAIVPAPGLTFAADGRADDPARNWAVLELNTGGRRDARVQPVPLASPTDRDSLGDDSVFTLVAFTPQRPFVATMAEGCRLLQIRGEPRLLLHDCAATAAVAGAPVFTDTGAGPILVGIQIGTGSLDGEPVGVAAMLERILDPGVLLDGRTDNP